MTDVDEKKDEQTAVVDDTKAEPTKDAAAESDTAQEDGLDELLKEFDERKEAATPDAKSEPKSEPKTDKQVDLDALATLEKRLNDQEAREQRRELENLFSKLTNGVQADEVDAEAFLNAKAMREPKLNQAYANRASNPKAWDKVFATLHQEFQKRHGKKVDKQVTDSKAAVASAVRSASTAAPRGELTEQEIKTASKADFDEMQRKLGVTPV